VNRKGVTLIELIVVMIIIAIGALLMAPNIGAWLPNYRLRSATRDIISTMRTAQMKAVSTNMEYRVLFDPGAKTYSLQRNSGGWQPDGATQALPSGIEISAINFGGNNAQFNSNSTASGGSITLRNIRSTEKKITLTTSTGRIKIE
jgi:prepilin-type N-terminal cleavage/methylation domain-containing protein